MGRGRQKAKQTKVARKLKYFSPDTDLSALQRELASGRGSSGHALHDGDADDTGEDLHSKYVVPDDDEDEDDWSHTPSGTGH